MLSSLNKESADQGDLKNLIIASEAQFPEVTRARKAFQMEEEQLNSLIGLYRKRLGMRNLEFMSVSGITHLIELETDVKVPSNWVKEENPETSVFLIQLPAALPAIIGSASSGSQDGSESSSKPQGSMKKVKPCKLNELPPGLVGKMLVYKSGAIKLKLGSTLYDVSPGSDCTFAQDVAVMNTGEKHCCAIGEISKRVIVTPDIDDMISVTRWVKPPIGKVKLNCNTSLSLAMGVAAGAYILTLFAVMSNLLYFCGMCRVAKEMLLKRYYSKVYFVHPNSLFLLPFSEAELFAFIYGDRTFEDGDYAVYGTIMGVIGGSNWFVAQCRCGIEVVLKLGHTIVKSLQSMLICFP
ncbi:hypothetical protein HN51_028406 [Arachis hypogaea]